ncbi:UNVERIFIED_CONTAM: hypothetical protein Sradi_0140700 [Sesamum radiatum]|uniref:Uncharacterized protein n=1 Tax=Sesamum radiatum TaxID=300843 RepID=A0AAW2WKM6_SESRA
MDFNFLVAICLDHYIDRVVDVYLDVRVDDLGAKIGSSNVRVETNKGININENDTNQTDSEDFEGFSDSEYEMGESEEENDDELFNENINTDAEWTRNNNRDGGGENDGGAESDGRVEWNKGSSDENFDSGEDSESEQRAKHIAIESIENKVEEQYGMLWNYVDELRKSNPRSIVILKLDSDEGTGARRFGKFYVCFEALKQGFKSGCRLLIGVDGCHLKGPFEGVLLTAIGINPNNNSFPIAYAVSMGLIYGNKTQLEPPVPPNLRRSVGRPSKARRLELDESIQKHRKRETKEECFD